MIRFALPILVAAALAGCSGSLAEAVAPSVNIVSDSYCAIAKKRTWDVNDTQQSIDEARTENHKWDCLCTEMRGKPECRKYQQATS